MHKALVGGAGLVPRHLTLVPYLTPEEVQQLAAACQGRHRVRDALLIDTLFQTGLRISEALALTPRHLGSLHGGTVLTIQGKGGKPRLVACPELLAARLKGYAYDQGLGLDNRLFPISRKRGWQIIKAAAARAGLPKKVWPHLLRHSDAIERLRQTGNPKALPLLSCKPCSDNHFFVPLNLLLGHYYFFLLSNISQRNALNTTKLIP